VSPIGRYFGATLSETPVASMNSPGEAPMLSETYTSWKISEKNFRCGAVILILQRNLHKVWYRRASECVDNTIGIDRALPITIAPREKRNSPWPQR
jgi:hypothetical protein